MAALDSLREVRIDPVTPGGISSSILLERGAEVADPPRSKPDVGYRFELEGEVIEILGPDGCVLTPRPSGASGPSASRGAARP